MGGWRQHRGDASHLNAKQEFGYFRIVIFFVSVNEPATSL
jgi:hypothetical protein